LIKMMSDRGFSQRWIFILKPYWIMVQLG
jgi:hypothetical protein